jgi:hypothetical protein
MRKLILTPEWKCSPISIDYSDGFNDPWFDEFGSVIEPEKLPLPKELIKEIWAWAEVFDTFLDWSDPGTPKYVDPTIKEDFFAKGEALANRIQLELGDDYLVRFIGKNQ